MSSFGRSIGMYLIIYFTGLSDLILNVKYSMF